MDSQLTKRTVAYRIKLRNLIILLSLSVGLSVNSYADEVVDNCAYDENKMLELDPWDFDQDPEKGWPRVAEQDECLEDAADLIQTYYDNRELPPSARRLMKWHEGQLRAEIGQSEKALALFKQGEKTGEDRSGWNYYVRATVAFMEQDLDALKANREKLAAVPKPDNLPPMHDEDGNEVEIQWPMNLHVVDRLVACFGRPYKDAYGECEEE